MERQRLGSAIGACAWWICIQTRRERQRSIGSFECGYCPQWIWKFQQCLDRGRRRWRSACGYWFPVRARRLVAIFWHPGRPRGFGLLQQPRYWRCTRWRRPIRLDSRWSKRLGTCLDQIVYRKEWPTRRGLADPIEVWWGGHWYEGIGP